MEESEGAAASWQFGEETLLLKSNLDEVVKGSHAPKPLVVPIYNSSIYVLENAEEGKELSMNQSEVRSPLLYAVEFFFFFFEWGGLVLALRSFTRIAEFTKFEQYIVNNKIKPITQSTGKIYIVLLGPTSHSRLQGLTFPM